MSTALDVLLPSDVFPPRCGGAGWSAHALALALIERGHAVTAIVPRRMTKGEREVEASPHHPVTPSPRHPVTSSPRHPVTPAQRRRGCPRRSDHPRGLLGPAHPDHPKLLS